MPCIKNAHACNGAYICPSKPVVIQGYSMVSQLICLLTTLVSFLGGGGEMQSGGKAHAY